MSCHLQALFLGRQYRRVLLLLNNMGMVESSPKFRYLAARCAQIDCEQPVFDSSRLALLRSQEPLRMLPCAAFSLAAPLAILSSVTWPPISDSQVHTLTYHSVQVPG